MDTKERKPRSTAVEEKWWHFALVGVVLTLVAAAVLGPTLVDVIHGPGEAAPLQAQSIGGATLIEVSAAPSE